MANISVNLDQSGKLVELDQRDSVEFDLGQKDHIKFGLGQADQSEFSLSDAQLVYAGLRWEEDPIDGGLVKYNAETNKYSTVTADSVVTEESEIVSGKAIIDYVKENGGKIGTISVNGENIEIDPNKNVNITVATKTSELTNDGDGTSKFATEEFVQQNGGKINTISINGETQPIDENKNVDIKLPSNIAETDKNNNFTAGQTINGTLTVNGDIVQNGDSYETHAEQVYTKNDTIILREGAVGGLGLNQYAGFEAEKYDGENTGVLGFGADGVARVGDKGNEQPLLTRQESEDLNNGDVMVWNSETNRAEGSGDYVKKTDYATYTTPGLMRPTNGLSLFGTNKDGVGIVKATNAQIDDKTDNYNPIVSSNLDYAVVVGLTTNKETLTDEQKTAVNNWLGINTYGEATTEQAGIIKLATDEDITAGTDTSKAVTPAQLKTAIEENVPEIDTSNLVDLTSEQTISGKKLLTSPVWIEVPNGSYKNIVLRSSGTSNRPSIDIGHNDNSVNSSWGSVVLGYNNSNTQNNTIAIGSGNKSIVNANHNIMIGENNVAGKSNNGGDQFSENVIIGYQSSSSKSTIGGDRNIVIGYNAKTGYTADVLAVNDAIQLGTGTNQTSKTLQVYDYQLLDGNTGKIPNERLDIKIETATSDDIDALFATELITQTGSDLYIEQTGATITQDGTNITIGG